MAIQSDSGTTSNHPPQQSPDARPSRRGARPLVVGGLLRAEPRRACAMVRYLGSKSSKTFLASSLAAKTATAASDAPSAVTIFFGCIRLSAIVGCTSCRRGRVAHATFRTLHLDRAASPVCRSARPTTPSSERRAELPSTCFSNPHGTPAHHPTCPKCHRSTNASLFPKVQNRRTPPCPCIQRSSIDTTDVIDRGMMSCNTLCVITRYVLSGRRETKPIYRIHSM